MQQLPQDQRDVFLLKDFAALTYEQIAEITGHSPRAIKHHLHQARPSLREAIDRLTKRRLNMSQRFKDKVALITGGNSGMGKDTFSAKPLSSFHRTW